MEQLHIDELKKGMPLTYINGTQAVVIGIITGEWGEVVSFLVNLNGFTATYQRYHCEHLFKELALYGTV